LCISHTTLVLTLKAENGADYIMYAFAGVSRVIAALVYAIAGDVPAAPELVRTQPVVIEHASMTAYPKADCTKIHMCVKNLCPYPVVVEGVYLGDKFLDLDPAHLAHGADDGASVSATGGMHEHHGSAPAAIPGRVDRSVQWCRALPNPIEPMGIGGVTISLWGLVGDASIRISLRGAGELRWEAKEEKPSLRLSHVAFDPADPNRMYVYCENKAGEDIVIDRVLVNAESAEIAASVPTGCVVKAGKKICFIVHPRQKMSWGKYAGIGVVGKNGEKAFSVLRVINYFPVGSWSADTRPEMFFDSADLHKPMRGAKANQDAAGSTEDALETAAFAGVGRPCQAFYDGRDPTCDDAGWTRNAQRIICAMSRLGGGSSPIPYYTHVCSPFEREYAFFAELPDLAFINPYTILYRAVSPWESGNRIELARTWADPRPVAAVPEAFCEGKAERDLSPDEVSFALWNEIAAGAKGVRYFTRNCSAPNRGYAQLPGVEARMARDNLDLQLLKGFLRISDAFPLAWASDGEFACKAVLCGEDGIVLFLFNKRFTGGKKSMSLWNPQDPSRFGAELPKGLGVNRVFQVDGGFREIPFRNKDGAVEFDLPVIDTAAAFLLASDGGNNAHRPAAVADAAREIEFPGANGAGPAEIVAQYRVRVQKLAAPLLNPSVTMERETLIDLARRLHSEKATALRALSEFDRALPNRGADATQRLFELASAYVDLGLDEDAFAVCRRFSKGSDAGVAATLCRRLSSHALAAGNYRLAIRCLELASNLGNAREARRETLSQLVELCDKKLRHPEETLKWIEAAVESAGGDRGGIARLRVRAAQLCLDANRADEAMRHLKAIDRTDWAVWNVDYLLGCAFAKKGEADKAVEHFRASVAHREAQADQAQFLIGWLLLTGGNRKEAAAEFRRLVERYPTSPCVAKARELMTGKATSSGESTAWRAASDRQ